jgi:radical SAM protein with 4Fe4S-binding SPASM domain
MAKKQALIDNVPITIIWHGGEPLTLPNMSIDKTIEFYENANILFNRLLNGIVWNQYFQTSLIHYSSKFANLILNSHNAFISTSYDKYRHIKGSKSRYTNLWEEKIHQARNDGLDIGITLVPDSTMTSLSASQKVANYLISLNFYSVHIDRGLGADKAIPNNLQHATILQNLYQIQSESNIVFSAVTAAINLIHDHHNDVFTASDRWLPSCTKSFFTIEPTGHTHACPDIAASDSWAPEQDALNRTRWIRKQVNKPNNSLCQSCFFLASCQGGCPITPIFDSSGECAGYKTFLSNLYEEFYPNSIRPTLELKNIS